MTVKELHALLGEAIEMGNEHSVVAFRCSRCVSNNSLDDRYVIDGVDIRFSQTTLTSEDSE